VCPHSATFFRAVFHIVPVQRPAKLSEEIWHIIYLHALFRYYIVSLQDLENTVGAWDMYGQEDKKRYPDLQNEFFERAAGGLSSRGSMLRFLTVGAYSAAPLSSVEPSVGLKISDISYAVMFTSYI
jgi:hypothetical protein